MRLLGELDVRLSTSEEVAMLRRAARLAGLAVRFVRPLVLPGMRLCDLAAAARRFVAQGGARDIAVHASVNGVAAHGEPDASALARGDIVTVDVSLTLGGWYGDAAWTFVAGRAAPEVLRLRRAAWMSAWAAIRAARAGARLSAVARAAAEAANRLGFSVLAECAGHGIGRALHEEPAIVYGDGAVDGYLAPGMVFTVEPVVTTGHGGLSPVTAGEALVTLDGARTAQFEHTVAVHGGYTEVLDLPGACRVRSLGRVGAPCA